jgi:hypothetical protein
MSFALPGLFLTEFLLFSLKAMEQVDDDITDPG